MDAATTALCAVSNHDNGMPHLYKKIKESAGVQAVISPLPKAITNAQISLMVEEEDLDTIRCQKHVQF
ncbi:MAG: hypothetical protein ACLTLQ_21090 [[Clostridium] scindens]